MAINVSPCTNKLTKIKSFRIIVMRFQGSEGGGGIFLFMTTSEPPLDLTLYAEWKPGTP